MRSSACVAGASTAPKFTAQLVGTFAEERRVRSGDPRAVGLRCRRTPLQFGHEFAQALLHPRLGAIGKGASFAFEDGALVRQRTALAFGGKPLGPQAVAFGLQLGGAQGEFGQGRLVVALSRIEQRLGAFERHLR